MSEHARIGGVNLLAPAKINLCLHMTGRRDDGYHLIDSLVAFADTGDHVIIEPSPGFSFQVTGPFARDFPPAALDDGPQSANIVVRAARGFASLVRREPHVKITLQKNMPLASGIGGGSADAAATIWGLMEIWGIKAEALRDLDAFMLSLGADVPVCLRSEPRWMRGIGEKLSPAPQMGEVPVVLAHCGHPCATRDVFKSFAGPFTQAPAMAARFEDVHDLAASLSDARNDLTTAALDHVPDIVFTLDALQAQAGCLLARMSGSGASCFGIFADADLAMDAAARLREDHPGWWVRAATLNRVGRY